MGGHEDRNTSSGVLGEPGRTGRVPRDSSHIGPLRVAFTSVTCRTNGAAAPYA